MEPHCLPHVTELSRTQKVDASVKFASISVGEERQSTRTQSTRTKCLVRAFNELQRGRLPLRRRRTLLVVERQFGLRPGPG